MKGINAFCKIKRFCNRIINSEFFPILLGLFLFIKVAIFYKLTIYKGEEYSSQILSKSFIYSMFIVTFLFLFRNRPRFVIGTIFNILISLLLFADNLYYNYSTSFISISQISNLQYSEQIAASFKDIFYVVDLVYFIDIIVIALMLITRFLKIEKTRAKVWKLAVTYISIMAVLYTSTISTYVVAAEEYRYNKKMQLEHGTIYTFHYLDVKTNIDLKKTAKYKNKEDLQFAYGNLKETYYENYNEDLYGVNGTGSGMNVIVLQLESFQNFLVNKTINGKEITPNLNKFLKENIHFENMMSQSYSTTADSEHSTMTSLYPLENGMAFAHYSGNDYDDFFKIFQNEGYYTVYMHGNEGGFWNRNNVYDHMEIDEIDFMNSFDENSSKINNWISDEALYEQAVPKLQNAVDTVEKTFFASIVAASSHTAFDLPGLDNKYDYVDIDVGPYKDMYFGNYLEAVNYSDKQFGMFIEKLKEAGLYDNTVLFVFGDHYGMQMYNYEMLDFIEEQDHKYNNIETEINYINVLCGMRIPGVSNKTISKVTSKLDIKPTLCAIMGCVDNFSLGTSMFGDKNFVCLNNGIIVTDEYYYNGNWYERNSGEKIDFEAIDDKTRDNLNYYLECMDNEISISNSVVLNNLLK